MRNVKLQMYLQYKQEYINFLFFNYIMRAIYFIAIFINT